MSTSKLSSKGQLVIPLEVRRRHGWEAGTELVIEDLGDAVVLRLAGAAAPVSLDELIGCTGYSGPPRDLGDMEAGIAEGARRSHR